MLSAACVQIQIALASAILGGTDQQNCTSSLSPHCTNQLPEIEVLWGNHWYTCGEKIGMLLFLHMKNTLDDY